MSGYIYRIARADADKLKDIVRDVVGFPCWTFGGASVWDFDRCKGRGNLRSITEITDAASIDISGDFGHAFSEKAEARWKRIDATTYDVLILSEQPRNVDDATRIGGEWQTTSPSQAAVLQTGDAKPICYIAYHAPNGAVQFLRYTGVKP